MRFKHKPVLMVRAVGKCVQIYLQQSNRKADLILDREIFSDLLQAMILVDRMPEKQEGETPVIHLHVAGNDQNT